MVDVDLDVAVEVGDVEKLLEVVGSDLAFLLESLGRRLVDRVLLVSGCGHEGSSYTQVVPANRTRSFLRLGRRRRRGVLARSALRIGDHRPSLGRGPGRTVGR